MEFMSSLNTNEHRTAEDDPPNNKKNHHRARPACTQPAVKSGDVRPRQIRRIPKLATVYSCMEFNQLGTRLVCNYYLVVANIVM